jgi:hypothetical protein
MRSLLLRALGAAALACPVAAQIATTAADFDQPGTQPGDLTDPILSYNGCTFCHGNFDEAQEPFERWSGGMMANSMRDPVFHAALTIANQDMQDSGSLCLRCHAPGGFLAGRATPADGSALTDTDFEGVSCHLCHRLVDPVADPANPADDAAILAALADPPSTSHGGQYVVDPEDRRRGPFDLGVFSYHDWRQSPYHRESLLCASCHEVSNPAFTRGGVPKARSFPFRGGDEHSSDAYVLGPPGKEHPTHEKTDEFPLERTFTEWLLSDFADGPIEMGGRFGGNQTAVSTCQDCHMPDTDGTACQPFLGGAVRSDLPQHDFAGANSWVPRSIYSLDTSLLLYPETHVNGQPLFVFEAAIARNKAMLRAASDLSLAQVGSDLVARITNQTGHKLPTGYGEGRRMWLEVKFYARTELIAEHGHYNHAAAELTTGDTKVYELVHGLDELMAARTGLPAGPSFHFVLNNEIQKDNRIPPRGFDNAAFAAGQAAPVAAIYADGQYWDDTAFPIPAGATHATVAVYHQTTSKEYIEFLRDANTTDDTGDIAYDEWVAAGMSKPVLMDRGTLVFTPRHVLPSR